MVGKRLSPEAKIRVGHQQLRSAYDVQIERIGEQDRYRGSGVIAKLILQDIESLERHFPQIITATDQIPIEE